MSKVSEKKLVWEQNVFINYFFFRQEHYQTIRRTNNGCVPGAVTAKVKSINIKIVFSRGSAVVFCIHGNKWGVANCCEDFDIPETGGDKDSLVSVIMVISECH